MSRTSGKSIDGQGNVDLSERILRIPNYFLEPADIDDEFDDLDPRSLHRSLQHVTSGKGVKVAVLDSGIDFDHPALRPNIKDCADFTNSVMGCKDEDGHGTLVAGIIAAIKLGKNMVGMAPEAELYIAKVINRYGEDGDIGRLKAGIEWAIASEVHLINISLGGDRDFSVIQAVLDLALSKKIFVICAAGNNGENGLDFPARYNKCVAVGAVDNVNRRWEKDGFSSAVGDELDVVALGKHVKSTYPTYLGNGRGYNRGSGTSMAAPFVTGALAWVTAKQRNGSVSNPIRSLEELLERFERTSKDLGLEGRDREFGSGRIDPIKLLDSI